MLYGPTTRVGDLACNENVPDGQPSGGPRIITLPEVHSATHGRTRAEATEEESMVLSARNQLKGTVVEVTKGQTTAHVRIDVGGARLMASITNEAVDELKLTRGMTVYAIIKASDVIVATD